MSDSVYKARDILRSSREWETATQTMDPHGTFQQLRVRRNRRKATTAREKAERKFLKEVNKAKGRTQK